MWEIITIIIVISAFALIYRSVTEQLREIVKQAIRDAFQERDDNRD